MSSAKPGWLEHQQKRFTRENAYLYIRPDADRWLRPEARHLLPPNWRRPGDRYANRATPDAPETHAADVSAETEALRFRAEIAAIRFELALMKAARFFRKYSPNQPRVPAGTPEGGNGQAKRVKAIRGLPRRDLVPNCSQRISVQRAEYHVRSKPNVWINTGETHFIVP